MAGLTVEQQQRIEAGIKRLENMSPADRKKLLNRYHRFEELSPDQQESVRSMARQFHTLPENRRSAVKQELDGLRNMTETERENRLKSGDFKGRFNSTERQIIDATSMILPDQM